MVTVCERCDGRARRFPPSARPMVSPSTADANFVEYILARPFAIALPMMVWRGDGTAGTGSTRRCQLEPDRRARRGVVFGDQGFQVVE